MLDSVAQSKTDIDAGSKSFSFASAIFSKTERQNCWKLYAWCRRADDAIDNSGSSEEALVALHDLDFKTRAAFNNREVFGHPWEGLREIATKYRLPEEAALDLLRGFEYDAKANVQIINQEDLIDYCYCVAGTVGILMCPLMGVQASAAKSSAIALGSAMQLTNIARDVREDFSRGRVYLPLTWLVESGIDPLKILELENKVPLYKTVCRLIELAEELYDVGLKGLHYLPWRSALAVRTAAYIYRDIGRQIRVSGPEVKLDRMVIGRNRKLVLFFIAASTFTQQQVKRFISEFIGRKIMRPQSFLGEAYVYVSRVRQFSSTDWFVYTAWVGLMYGLFFAVTAFLYLGLKTGVEYPSYVWNIPVGIFIFSTAIAVDTIGHRTIYKDFIAQGEDLVHHITIFSGISSTLLLCFAYSYPNFLKIPVLVLILLSVFYSIVDEALHWHRYMTKNSDRVEMWSHFFIFLGHMIMILAWWHWFAEGYPGVRETIRRSPLLQP